MTKQRLYILPQKISYSIKYHDRNPWAIDVKEEMRRNWFSNSSSVCMERNRKLEECLGEVILGESKKSFRVILPH